MIFRVEYKTPGRGTFPRYVAEVRTDAGDWVEVARYVAPWIVGAACMGRSRLVFLSRANTLVPEWLRAVVSAALRSEKTSEYTITESTP